MEREREREGKERERDTDTERQRERTGEKRNKIPDNFIKPLWKRYIRGQS